MAGSTASFLYFLGGRAHVSPSQVQSWVGQIAGTVNAITDVDVATSAVSFDYATPIPFELRDDDETFTPKLAPLSAATAAFKDAYILALADGGGIQNTETLNIPFILNLPSEAGDLHALLEQGFGSRLRRSNGYWIAYVLTAFQEETLMDYDSNFESAGNGITVGGSSCVLAEQLRDTLVGATPRLLDGTPVTLDLAWEISTAHEIGHQFGLGHSDATLLNSTVSGSTLWFSNQQIDYLRSSAAGPRDSAGQ